MAKDFRHIWDRNVLCSHDWFPWQRHQHHNPPLSSAPQENNHTTYAKPGSLGYSDHCAGISSDVPHAHVGTTTASRDLELYVVLICQWRLWYDIHCYSCRNEWYYVSRAQTALTSPLYKTKKHDLSRGCHVVMRDIGQSAASDWLQQGCARQGRFQLRPRMDYFWSLGYILHYFPGVFWLFYAAVYDRELPLLDL